MFPIAPIHIALPMRRRLLGALAGDPVVNEAPPRPARRHKVRLRTRGAV